MNSVCVFCGSSAGRGEIYLDQAKKLGEKIAKENLSLIYGGSNIGLMGMLADTVLANGGNVIGVMPESLISKEIAHNNLTKFHVVQTMSERKNLMAELSDAFITLPGGFGTFDELSEVLTWYQLEMTNKSCAILNINNYFDHFIKMLDHSVEEKFLRQEHRDNIIIDSDIDLLFDKMRSFKRNHIDKKWIDDLKKNNSF